MQKNNINALYVLTVELSFTTIILYLNLTNYIKNIENKNSLRKLRENFYIIREDR